MNFDFNLAAKSRKLDDPPAAQHVSRFDRSGFRHSFLVRWRGGVCFKFCCGWLAGTLLLASGSSLAQETDTKPSSKENPTVATKPSPGKLEKLPAPFLKDAPSTIYDLKAVERHVKSLVSRLSPAVVAVQVGGGSGSGVVISKDGLVLCAAHVCGRPGRDVTFTFSDGKTARGKTLGTDHDRDSGLMQITDEGPWPSVTMGELNHARLGDWVLAFGHPGGFDLDRPIVVRIGRIISLAGGFLQTDCTLISGDSGGPLFDMHGRVIAIHSRISDSTAANFHVPIKTFYDTWDRLAKGESWGDQRPAFFAYLGARGVDHPDGCQLENVDENSPAAKAGLKAGDIVIKINNREIKSYDSLRETIANSRPGAELTLQIKRDDKPMSVRVTVESRGRRGRSTP